MPPRPPTRSTTGRASGRVSGRTLLQAGGDLRVLTA